MEDIAEKEIDDIKLLDLIDVEVLQRVETMFSQMTRMAALTTDADGVVLTEGINFSRVCMEFCRKSPEGRKRCEQCDKMGATTALEQKAPLYYYCHANLIDFAAPIMLNGRMIGSFIGGQIVTKKPNPDDMRRVAKEIEVDEEAFIKAAQETQVVPIAAINRAANFIYGYAELLSEMAYKAYQAHKMTIEALHAAAVKSDFLANMSHEIRTPLNSVLGMTQIALREEMTDAARNCMLQIMNSGKMLLTIINDILDYSKIESGKVTLTYNEYDIQSLIQDVVAIIANRIGDKNIELIIDLEPSIPRRLYGDETRLKQILVNLANNAVKFTNEGYVALRISYHWTASGEIKLKGKVQDTGIGIEKKDFERLFDSFQQVDSKRNREIEGTGLGLAIVKNLVELMDGRILVESEYGKGSTFSFEVSQKVIDRHPCITPFEDCSCVVGLIDNPYLNTELRRDVERIGAQYLWADKEEDVDSLLKQTEAKFLFVSENLLSDKLLQYVLALKELTTVRLVSYNNTDYKEIAGILTIRKPLYSTNIAALLKEIPLEIPADEANTELDFTAPDASILVVDDNEINLTVATGLLEPLHMQVNTALSGIRAIEMAGKTQYDIIFMDHMMPHMDGVEATHIIRDTLPAYADVPIIALTANAVRGTREMLIREGMNDFIAKPIEFQVLLAKVKTYLPPEKIMPMDSPHAGADIPSKQSNDTAPAESISIPGLDTDYAFRILGTPQLFWRVLKDYYRVIDKKCEKIKQCELEEDWKEYCIEAHSLKSASRQIGALALAENAKRMEDASREKNAALVHQMTDALLTEYRQIQETLTPYCREEKMVGTEKIPREVLRGFLEEMQNALDSLDIGATEKTLTKMDKYAYEGESAAYFKKLETAIEDFDIEDADKILAEWRKTIQ